MIDIAEAFVLAAAARNAVHPIDDRIALRRVDAPHTEEVLRRHQLAELPDGNLVGLGSHVRNVDAIVVERGEPLSSVAPQVPVDVRGVKGQDSPEVSTEGTPERHGRGRVRPDRLHVTWGRRLPVELHVETVGVDDGLGDWDARYTFDAAPFQDAIPRVRGIQGCIEARDELRLHEPRR